MIITCEACNTSFNLDDKMLKPTGSKVRCSVCAKVFTAYPPQTPPPEPVIESGEPKAEPGPDAGLAAVAAAVADETVQADNGHAPKTDMLDQEADALFGEGTDLDSALDDEPEKGAPDREIEDAVNDALDDDLSGISLEPESEPAAALESDVSIESDATIIADLDADDLDLSPEPSDETDSETPSADLDVDDLDIPLEEDSAEAETIMVDLDDDDLDIETPLDHDAEQEDSATVITNLEDDSLELDDDFSLEIEDSGSAAASGSDTLPENADELGDLDLSLDLEPSVEAEADGETPTEDIDASLEELSMDFDLEADDEKIEDQPEADAGNAAADELDLALDLDDAGGGEKESASPSPTLEDDLDLSGLEELLKDDEEVEDKGATLLVDEDEASGLALEMEDETPTRPDADHADDAGETLEELELDLEGDGTGETVASDDADDADQEIDLSEIEKMLEEPETGSTQFSSVPEQDLDLDIEASLETEKWMSDSSDDDKLVKDQELDLSELEQVLEDVELDGGDDKAAEDPDLELELDLEEPGGPETAADKIATDTELDFDMSDFEEAAPSTSSAQKESREPEDMELEFEIEEDGEPAESQEDEGLEETVAIPEPKAEKDEETQPEPVAVSAPAPKPAKKGMSKSLVFLLIIAILGGLAYGTYYVLNTNGIEIPFLSDYLKPKVQDPGNLKLTTFDINSRFVDNANVGKLFVISGKVKNGYPENRGMITLVGKIFSTGKVPIHEEKVYCGNVMSDLELANLPWNKIKSRLSNRLGDNRSNVKIEPGKSIPFMVVFSGLPDDLEEFTIEVTGSTTLK